MDVADLEKTLNLLIRQDRGRLLSALASRFQNLDLAEDALQEACSSAFIHWGRSNLPDNPKGWLYRAAFRKALDKLRKIQKESHIAKELTIVFPDLDDCDLEEIPDERLRMIFTCCHPALELKSQIALTLRTLGGLTTEEIARAFLDQDATIGQRISRAKSKISKAGIAYEIPNLSQCPQRREAVLRVIYLIFNEGYYVSKGEIPLRKALCEEAIYLARVLNFLMKDDAESLGLLALMLFTHARHRARISGAGIVPLEAQDKLLWDVNLVKEAQSFLDHALTLKTPGPYQIQAAISSLHTQTGKKDWHQIGLLYATLYRYDPNPVIKLNWAVAIGENGQIDDALIMIEALTDELFDYQPYFCAKADLLVKKGEIDAAKEAYERAISLTSNRADQTFLKGRYDSL